MAVNRAARVEVKGANELRRALRDMGDRQLMRELGKLHQDVARYVVRKAQAKASGQGRQASRAAREALKPMRTQSAARVVLANTARVPYALGAEFGAKQDQRRRVVRRGPLAEGETPAGARFMQGWNQFRPWAGNAFSSGVDGGSGGYWLFPTIRAERDSIIDTYVDAVDAFVDKTLPDGPRR